MAVHAREPLVRRAEGVAGDAPLVLHGKEMELLSLSLDGKAMAEGDYELGEQEITRFRADYERRWNRLHLIRTIFAVASFIVALLVVFTPVQTA